MKVHYDAELYPSEILCLGYKITILKRKLLEFTPTLDFAASCCRSYFYCKIMKFGVEVADTPI